MSDKNYDENRYFAEGLKFSMIVILFQANYKYI